MPNFLGQILSSILTTEKIRQSWEPVELGSELVSPVRKWLQKTEARQATNTAFDADRRILMESFSRLRRD
jgi:hypothetical protein